MVARSVVKAWTRSMSLTLDSPDTDRMARELASLTGETVEDAVANALRDRLDRERRWRGREELLALTRRIVRESGPDGEAAGEDPSAFLYDERGLPA
jgi:antitoxin VapB